MRHARALLPILLLTAACSAPAADAPASASVAEDSNWIAKTALYEVFVRDFSSEGTLRGVIDGLDRIQATGANVIWLMPIHPVGVANRKGSLGSSYSIRDYRAVNPDYGTADDFRALVEAVHDRGMKLIIDWVPNHTAWDHHWVQEHPDFYRRDAQGNLSVPIDNEGKLTDWTDVADLDYTNPALRREMIAAMRYWLDEYGIDGFRVDVAGMVPDEFWREAVPQLRADGRPILLLAEWGEPKMHALGFDLSYGWDAYHRLKAVWKGDSAAAFVTKDIADLAALPGDGMRLRFTTNHDETAWDQPAVTLFGGDHGARAAFAAMALLPGPALLYNGQEVESPQKLGLFERETVAWDQPGADSARAFYRRVIELDRTQDDFVGDELRAIETSAPLDIIAYSRGESLVLVNARARAVSFDVSGYNLSGTSALIGEMGLVDGSRVSLPAYGVLVLGR